VTSSLWDAAVERVRLSLDEEQLAAQLLACNRWHEIELTDEQVEKLSNGPSLQLLTYLRKAHEAELRADLQHSDGYHSDLVWDRVKELAAKGLFAREIAAQLGMRPALVRADAKRAGIALAKEQGSWAAKGTQASQLGRTKKVTARREMLKRVFRPDLTRQQILEALKAEGFDVKIGSLEADMIALDLKVNRKGKSTAPDRIEMARGEILSLREMGLSPITVARRVGLSVGRVMQVLSEEGRHAA
jgi:hypothetical protein